MISWIGFAGGVVLLGITWSSVVKTFMLPRETHTKLNMIVSRCVYGLFMLLTKNVRDLVRRERILSAAAPAFPA